MYRAKFFEANPTSLKLRLALRSFGFYYDQQHNLLKTKAIHPQFKKLGVFWRSRIKNHLRTTFTGVWYAHEQLDYDVAMLEKIMYQEAQHPGYQSFAHGAPSIIRVLLELQKKLYAQYYNSSPTNFEFLRARTGRHDLEGITREQYIKDHKEIVDGKTPDRDNLLSVAYVAWAQPFIYRYTRTLSLDINHLIEGVLMAYNLPGRSLRGAHLKLPPLPRINKGLILHILIKNSAAQRIVYNSKPFGKPCCSLEIPDKNDSERSSGQARIILDPTLFDQPNDDVKIVVYQDLTPAEKKSIDDWCDKVVRIFCHL